MTAPKCFINGKAPKSYCYACCCYQFIGYRWVPSHSPWGFGSLSGPSRSIPSLHDKILAKSSSVFLNNPKSRACGCCWGKSGIGGVAFARTWKSHFPISIYPPGDICHSSPLQMHGTSKPLLLLFSTRNQFPCLAQLSGQGFSSNASSTRESSCIFPVYSGQ